MMRAALVLLLATTTVASAHIKLTAPLPRTAEQKEGPCGATGSVRGTTVTTYQAGSTITVEWDETIDHPGHFRIAFDDDGNDVFVNPQRSTDNYPFTLVEPIADQAGGHYTQQVTLPATPCTNCTLQLMQIMTVTEPFDSFYYQCADIVLTAGPPPPPDAGVGGVDASTNGGHDAGRDGGGGGCSTTGGSGLGGALALALVARRRRRNVA